MKLAVASLAATIMTFTPARADTPERCVPLSLYEPVTVESVPAAEREAARSAIALAGMIARHRGSTIAPILVRLPESRPGSGHLVAYVPGPNEHVVALVYHSTALKQSHSLADARSILVQGVQEPRYETKRETGGTYFRLYTATRKESLFWDVR